MKHNLLISANGLCTPPCGSSRRKSLSFQFRNSLLLLFLLIVGTNAVWGSTSTSYFTPGVTIYFHVTSSAVWTTNSNSFQVILFDKDNNTNAIKNDNSTTIMDACDKHHPCNLYDYTGSGHHISSDVRRSLTKINDNYYSFKIPASGKKVGFIRLIRNDPGADGWSHQHQPQFSADNVPSNKNCFAYSAFDEGSVTYEEYSGGATVTTGSGGGDPAPEPLSGDYYVFGAGGINWVTGWTQNWNNENYKMTIKDGVATKTFKNVSGQGLEFKIHKGNTQYKSNLLLAEVKENNSHLISKVWKNNENIDFNISNINVTHKADVTVHFDGEHIWLTAVPSPETVTGSDWYIMGSGNVGTEHGLGWNKGDQMGLGNEHKMTVQGGVATITYYNVPNNISFKIFRGSDEYEINDFYYDASASSGIICTDQDGNDNINVNLNNKNISIHWDGTKIWTTAPPTPSGVTYDGSEIFYFHKKGGSLKSHYEDTHAYNGGNGAWVNDCALFLEFSNTNESSTARSTKVGYFWDTEGIGGNVLATRVPAGTWSKVRVLRTNNGDRGQVWERSNWVTLEEGKDYLNDNNTMAVYSPRTFHFYISGSTTLAETNSDFNAWNGNGTAHSGSMTKTLNAGTYKFKLNPTGTVDWRSEFNMDDLDAAHSSNNINLRDGNNKEIWFDLDKRSQVTIACDGSKVTVVATPVQQHTVIFNTNGGSTIDPVQVNDGSPVAQPADPTKDGYEFDSWRISSEEGAVYDFGSPVTDNIILVAKWKKKHTVTFNSNGGSEVAPQEVVDGQTAREPDAPRRDKYTFAGWKLGNALYDFATPVTDNIELVADWTYTPAHISSVSINYSSIYTWQGDATTYTLVPTLVPGDITDVTYIWSSSNNSVATVENGVITPQGKGTAIITCTATDYYSHPETATCTVVVEPCAKAPADVPSYSVTITGYNTSEGGNATLAGLWNESSDNGVMTQTARLVRIAFKDLATEYMTEDANGKVAGRASITDDSDKWMYYSAETGLFYLQNYNTGHFLYKDKSTSLMGQNGDWKFYGTKAAAYADADTYRWLENGSGDQLRICNKDGYNGNLNGSHTLMRYYVDAVDGWNTPYVRCGLGGHQGNNPIRAIITQVEASVDNPFFVSSQMNTSYYRMKENATVQANLASPFAKADVINVNLYADAATTVTLCKTNGDVVATISLNADEVTNYSYLVIEGTPLYNQSAFIIKAADNHAGIASITVRPMVAADPATPYLYWTTTPVKEHLLLGGHFTYTAASSDSQGAISYASGNTEIARVDVHTGEVTPAGAGTTTISATIAADECHAARTISYEVSFLSLQDYINTESVTNVTLPEDFTSENIVINKAITINGQGHTIGDLTVQTAGDLTLSSGLKVRDFTICAKAGNTSKPAASGQVRNAANLTCTGNAYFLYTVDPSGQVHYGWYDFTVPFPVNVMTGIAGIQNSSLNEDFVNERDYAIMEYLGERKAQGQYPYQKFRGVMQPNQLYSITLDSRDNYNTVRFQKTADGDLVASNTVTLNEYTGSGTYNNLNGVGNGTLHHADADNLSSDHVQVYQSGDKTFLTVDRNQYSFVVGTAFMVQETGRMTLSQANGDKSLLAPSRQASAPATAIQIAREGQPFSDQLFISASETGGQAYTQGTDLAKAGNIGNVSVPQIWTNAYNTKLCVHEAQLINGEASYNLSLYAPAADTYTLTSKNIPADYSLYLTQNGTILTELNGTYTLDLNKGITTEYGLLLVETYKTPTGMEESGIRSQESGIRKILHNGVLYILHNGKIYNAQGAKVK